MSLLHTMAGTALAAAALTVAACGASAGNRDLNVGQEPVAELGEGRGASHSIKVSAWVDRRDATYRPGDTLTLQVKAGKPSYITVLDIGTSGKVHVVFPNKYQRNNRVEAYEVVQIPEEDARFRLTVNGPAGREVLKVFATDKPIEFLNPQRLAAEGPYYLVPGDGRAIARDLSVELDGGHGANYGAAKQIIQIVSDGGESGAPLHGSPMGEDGMSPERLFNLGEAAYYGENGGSAGAALTLYMRAAEKGHVLAMVRIGQIYEEEAGDEATHLKAVEWYRKAADLGSTQAMVRLANLYGRGQGVPRDFAEALSWLAKAAKAGDGLAMAHLARAYDAGRGVARDPRQAAHYGLEAVRAGAWSVQSDMLRFSEETRHEMQRELRAAGFYSGPIDGVFGAETRAALIEYARAA